MKALNRKASVLIAILLMMGLLLVTACNRGDEDENGYDNGGTTQPPADTTTGTEPSDPPTTGGEDVAAIGGIHQPRDLGGAVLTGAMWWEGGIAYAMPLAYYTEPDPATSANYHRDRLIWDNARRVEREFNIQFDDHVFAGAMDVIPTLTTSVMAGDPIAELIFMESWHMLSAIHGDLIVPIDEINLPNSDLLGSRVYSRPRAEGFGHIWAFWTSALDASGAALGVNLDIINAIGAPNPVDLYNQGRWTWDAMLDIMRMATRDTTGDGIMDQWGIAGQPGTILRNFIGANDGILATNDLIYGFDHPNTMEALEFMETIIHEGLWFTDPGSEPDPGDWGRNFFAFTHGTSAFFESATWAINQESPLSFDFAVVPIPTGPSNYSGATWLGGWRQGYTIAAGSNWAPADVLMIIEEVFAWAGDEPELMSEGAILDARNTFLTEDCVQNQLAAVATMRPDMGYIVPEYAWQLDRFIRAFLTQEMTVAQAVEAERQPLQEMLDAFRN